MRARASPRRCGRLQEEADHVEPFANEGVGDALLVQNLREWLLRRRRGETQGDRVGDRPRERTRPDPAEARSGRDGGRSHLGLREAQPPRLVKRLVSADGLECAASDWLALLEEAQRSGRAVERKEEARARADLRRGEAVSRRRGGEQEARR